MKWEYKTVNDFDKPVLSQDLNKLDEQGWGLYKITSRKEVNTYIFRRERIVQVPTLECVLNTIEHYECRYVSKEVIEKMVENGRVNIEVVKNSSLGNILLSKES